jgi:hypothetical protein
VVGHTAGQGSPETTQVRQSEQQRAFKQIHTLKTQLAVIGFSRRGPAAGDGARAPAVILASPSRNRAALWQEDRGTEQHGL